jgi:hypothetical protein
MERIDLPEILAALADARPKLPLRKNALELLVWAIDRAKGRVLDGEQTLEARKALLALADDPYSPSRPDDIRAQGWVVACHNDYRHAGQPHTFWLFTRGERAVKGEGRTDAEALNEVRNRIDAIQEELTLRSTNHES